MGQRGLVPNVALFLSGYVGGLTVVQIEGYHGGLEPLAVHLGLLFHQLCVSRIALP